MKDKQSTAKAPTSSIPVISPVLHCLSMPVLVILRHNFGYLFLSPKSIFLSLIFACCLFAFMVFNDAGLKPRFMYLAGFGMLVSGLYVYHLVSAVKKQIGNKGNTEHDHYSGTSHLAAFVPPDKRQARESFVHGIVEPAVTCVAGLVVSLSPLGKVLLISGIALAFKELIRFWLSSRREKLMADGLVDARETMEKASEPVTTAPPPTATGRTGRERYRRAYTAESAVNSDEGLEHAKELRMMPPYSLEKAEENYAVLIQSIDTTSADAGQQLKRLKLAIGYFRQYGT